MRVLSGRSLRSESAWSGRRFVAQIIDGKKLRASILERVRAEAALLPKPPGLTVLQVGGHSDSTVYVRHKLTTAEACGMVARHVKLPRSSTQSDVLAAIHKYNNDMTTHGMLLQLPLDTENDISQEACINAIDPMKDVDGLHYVNAGLLSHGDIDKCLLPCTPRGCLELIKCTGVPIAGASAVVLGRSAIVGTPMAELLKWSNATVTIAHSKTANVKDLVRSADIVVAACRQKQLVTADWLKPGAIVIDVGIHAVPDESKKSGFRLTGDVDYESARQVAGWITPVPGHVGPMTVAMVVQNTLDCAKRFMSADHQSWNLRPLRLHGPVVSDDSPSELKRQTPSDLEISQQATPKWIGELCKEMRVFPHEFRSSGHFMAKLSSSLEERLDDNGLGKYVVVTSMSPTPLGEGKTTAVCGLTQALGAHFGRNVMATLRQPALGPLFSVKGGAAGGGFSQVIPMDKFNWHMTGDLHAIASAQNLLAASVDARIVNEANEANDDRLFTNLVGGKADGAFSDFQRVRLERLGITHKSPWDLTSEERRRFARLDIDPNSMVVSRAIDSNDEMLRNAVVGSRRSRFPRKRIFENTTACELMNILTLSKDINDFQERVARIVVALDRHGQAVVAADIGVVGAISWLMHEAIEPTLMQTLEGTPVLVHAGPFANTGVGNCSVIADRLAMKLVGHDGVVVTEAGHGADIGLEKFFNLKCRQSGLWPHCVVLVASSRALKLAGGAPTLRFGGQVPEEWRKEDLALLGAGASDLQKQLQNAQLFGVPVVVAVNAFATDSDAELEAMCAMAREFGAADVVLCRHWEQGGAGALDLAERVIQFCDGPAPPRKFLYDLSDPFMDKLETLVRQVHRIDRVELSMQARESLENIQRLGFDNLPLCLSKSPFRTATSPMIIRNIRVASGAGMLIPEVDTSVTLPMLPVRPSFFDINLRQNGVTGLK